MIKIRLGSTVGSECKRCPCGMSFASFIVHFLPYLRFLICNLGVKMPKNYIQNVPDI